MYTVVGSDYETSNPNNPNPQCYTIPLENISIDSCLIKGIRVRTNEYDGNTYGRFIVTGY